MGGSGPAVAHDSQSAAAGSSKRVAPQGRAFARAMRALTWALRFALLCVLFIAFYMAGSMAVAGAMPAGVELEPGLVSTTSGLLIIAVADVLVIAALVLHSRWNGWKLALSLALAYYGAVTLVLQMDTWHYLSSINVNRQLLLRLLLMGVPTAFLFVPLSVWVLGKGRAVARVMPRNALAMPAPQWAWKLAALVVAYLVLYWGAGYTIAWQNPALRAFYGQPGEALLFLAHTISTLRQDPLLFPLQVARALVWVLCALPVIRGSRLSPWWTAVLVGLFFSVPQNIGHIMANPFLPLASVRLSHMIETASSTFLFGVLVVWPLHRHRSAEPRRSTRAQEATC
jgi:hypothetical protein